MMKQGVGQPRVVVSSPSSDRPEKTEIERKKRKSSEVETATRHPADRTPTVPVETAGLASKGTTTTTPKVQVELTVPGLSTFGNFNGEIVTNAEIPTKCTLQVVIGQEYCIESKRSKLLDKIIVLRVIFTQWEFPPNGNSPPPK